MASAHEGHLRRGLLGLDSGEEEEDEGGGPQEEVEDDLVGVRDLSWWRE